MSWTTVINLRDRATVSAARRTGTLVIIDRRTPWGNPYILGRDGTRGEVIAKYRAYLATRPALLARLPELRGMTLACWCAPAGGTTAAGPLVCHGQVLAALADALPA